MENEREEEYLLPHRLVLCQGKANKFPLDESILGEGPPSTPYVHREPFAEKVWEFMGTSTKAQYCYHGLVYNRVGRLTGKLLLCGGADSLLV